MDYDDDEELMMEEPEGEGENGKADVEQGGILLLSDSDDDSSSEEEEEEDDDESQFLTESEKRKKLQEKVREQYLKRQHKYKTAPPPLIQRAKQPLIHKLEFGVGDFVELRLDGELAEGCRGANIFEGLPSKGLASVLISKFMIKGLKLPLIGSIVSNLLPVVCRITECHASHAFRVYGNSKVIVITSELACPPEISPSIADLVYYIQQKYDCQFIFCAESIPKGIEEMEIDLPDKESMSESDLIELVQQMALEEGKGKGKGKGKKKKPIASSSSVSGEDSKVSKFFGTKDAEGAKGLAKSLAEIMYITNDEPTSNKMRKLGYLPIQNAVVGNVTGYLLAESVGYSCNVVCLVARYNPVLSDARASVLLVRTISDIISSPWLEDLAMLEKKADRIEKRIRKSIREMGVTSKKNAPTSSYMYT